MKQNPILFFALLDSSGLTRPIQEYRFDSVRRWRFDFAWPEHKVALEVEGGIWVGGRHNRGSGFLCDMEKYNTAAVSGWRIIRRTPGLLSTTETVNLIRKALKLPKT